MAMQLIWCEKNRTSVFSSSPFVESVSLARDILFPFAELLARLIFLFVSL